MMFKKQKNSFQKTKNYFYVVGFGLFTLLSTACGTSGLSKNASAQQLLGNEVVEQNCIDIPTERPIYRASETILTDLIHTKLDVRPDWQKQYLYGTATITAKPHFYASDSLFLDAKGMDIHSVRLDEKTLNYSYKHDRLAIQLDKEYHRDQPYTVSIDYTAKPNEWVNANGEHIAWAKGLFFINPDGSLPNQMPQIWTQGETESSSIWFPTIDAPNTKTTQEIFITVENKYATLSNGKLVATTQNANGTRTDHWKQDLPHAPYLFMLAVGEFKIVKDLYTRKDGSTIDVHYYVEPEWEQYARSIFGETPNMLRYFSELLGVEYPWEKFHQIVVRQYVSGAMENTGAVVFGDFVYRTDRESLDANSDAIIAHELFHHWFGDLVTCESWSNLTLNEAFANYAQYLWDEHKYGRDQADFKASEETGQYLLQGQREGYHNLIWHDYNTKEQMFDRHTYNKGGRILHVLRTYLGDEAFFASLQKYLTDNQYKAAEFHHLRLACEEVSGQDLNWFFDQWFTASGHPDLTVSQEVENEEVVLKVVQKQDIAKMPIFKLPVQVAVVDESGKQIYDIEIDKIENEFRFPVQGRLQTIIFDYQAALLAEIKEEKPQEQWIAQYYHSQQWLTRHRALKYGMKNMTEQAQQLIFDALKDPFWHIRSSAIDRTIRLAGQNKEKALQFILQQMMKDEHPKVRAEVLYHIDRMELPDRIAYYTEALSDSSYEVIATALRFLGKIDVALAMTKAQSLEQERSANLIVAIGNLYAKNGDETKFQFFEKQLMSGQIGGMDELGLMNSLTSFITQHSDEIIQRAVPIYANLSKTGARYTKMFMIPNIQSITDELSERKKNDAQQSSQINNLILQYEEIIKQ